VLQLLDIWVNRLHQALDKANGLLKKWNTPMTKQFAKQFLKAKLDVDDIKDVSPTRSKADFSFTALGSWPQVCSVLGTVVH